MSFNLNSITLAGKEVYPIIEGGKGIAVSTGISAGAFAAAGAIGTFSGVNADFYDQNNQFINVIYEVKTRVERHFELIRNGIKGGIAQAKIAYENSRNQGLINMNILWEMGGAQEILNGILEGARGLFHGVTCGAGMPYKLAEIASHYKVYYYPIISSMRAFRALWKRSYHKYVDFLGAVVYEDPWLAGGHNGLSNEEDPTKPQSPMPRLIEIRKFMNDIGLNNVPIIMAGGVWHLNDWKDYIDNKEIGPIAFQFGTRPILTKESTVPESWKKRLLTLKEGDVFLNRYSPTGFYSSAVNNNFIKELRNIEERQIQYSSSETAELTSSLAFGARGRSIFVNKTDSIKAHKWISSGFDQLLKTPDSTVIFVTKEKAEQIHRDQVDCMGCLSSCRFSNWRDREDEDYTNGRRTDPRSYCIQKTLQEVVHDGDIENQLMFSGHNAYKFGQDPFYQNGFIPTVKELIDRIRIGL